MSDFSGGSEFKSVAFSLALVDKWRLEVGFALEPREAFSQNFHLHRSENGVTWRDGVVVFEAVCVPNGDLADTIGVTGAAVFETPEFCCSHVLVRSTRHVEWASIIHICSCTGPALVTA